MVWYWPRWSHSLTTHYLMIWFVQSTIFINAKSIFLCSCLFQFKPSLLFLFCLVDCYDNLVSWNCIFKHKYKYNVHSAFGLFLYTLIKFLLPHKTIYNQYYKINEFSYFKIQHGIIWKYCIRLFRNVHKIR